MKRLIEGFKKYLTEGTTILPTNKVGRIVYDPYEGLGSTPNGTEVDYMGFTVWMTPSNFIKLNPARGDESEFLAQHFQQEGDITVAPCWIAGEYLDGVWRVDGHEGRGRAIEINKIQPNELMPVHVFPREAMRARSLTKEMVLSPIQSEVSNFQVKPSTAILDGKVVESWRETSWTGADDEKVDIGQVVDYLGDNVVELNVSELSSQLPSLPTQGAERIAAASLDHPVIVVKSGGQYKYILDGNHRLQKAIDIEEETIKAKVLDLDNPETPEVFKRMFGGAA